MKKVLMLLAAVLAVSFAAGCSGGTATGSASKKTPSKSAGQSDAASYESGESAVESGDSSAGAGSAGATSSKGGSGGTAAGSKSGSSSSTASNDYHLDWSGSAAVIQDLGKVNLDAFPVDMSYEWGYHVLKVGGKYQIWWTRASPWDGLWYAESTDLKNWTKVQCIAKLYWDGFSKTYTRWMKMHIADPAVIYKDGVYHIWVESNATADATGDAYGDSVIMYATSTDGINLKWYPDNKDPQPVMKPAAKNMNKGLYGTGMPSVIYKDGKFLMYYYDGNNDVTRMAASTDGVHFPENEKNPVIINRAGVGAAYNTLTKKYMITFSQNPAAVDTSLPDVQNIYVLESDSPTKWPRDLAAAVKGDNLVVSSSKRVRAFPDFVKNALGMVDTPTAYMVFTDGEAAAPGKWWMDRAITFDGYVVAFNPRQFAKRPLDLPNGKKTSAANLKAYADKNITWNTRSSTAKKGTPTIDGKMDSIWNNTKELLVDRTGSTGGCMPTKTNGRLRVLWDENNLYIYERVYDAKVSYSYPIDKLGNMYHRDSIAIFVDVPRIRTGVNATEYTPQQYVFGACANGDKVVMNTSKNNMDLTAEFPGLKCSVARTGDGYIVEAAIPWHPLVKSLVKSGKIIGFDAGINDDLGRGDRDAAVAWSDYSGNAFRDYTMFGNLTLID